MHCLAMTWNDVLALGPTAISRAIGCSVSTAHTWIRRGGPAPWLQKLIIKAMEETSPNKASMATEGEAESNGKKKRNRAPSVP